jgi:hypothetical protein
MNLILIILVSSVVIQTLRKLLTFAHKFKTILNLMASQLSTKTKVFL